MAQTNQITHEDNQKKNLKTNKELANHQLQLDFKQPFHLVKKSRQYPSYSKVNSTS